MVRVRFAPSPTGHLHIGGARTALFNWLFARHEGGVFVLRIEDTDRTRSTDEYIESIMEGMKWLNLDWDEGPFRQTDRFDVYKACVEKLLAEGKAYHCYCTPEELEERRQRALAEGRPPRYDGRCRLLKEPVSGRTPSVRFKMPQTGHTLVNDLIRGPVSFDNNQLDDFIIARSDGTPTYNFVVVVDDVEMKITHVIRGDDHLNNTPKQIHIYESFGYETPKFAHLPMIMGSDKTRLSKRHGATSVMAYREMGYLPDALINYLARLGWSSGDQEIFTRDEMKAQFSMEHIGKSAAVFNPEKLLWLNGEYIRRTAPEELTDLVMPFLISKGLLKDPADISRPWLVKAVASLMERSKTLVQLADAMAFYLLETVEIDPQAREKFLNKETLDYLVDVRDGLSGLQDFTHEQLEKVFQEIVAKHGTKLAKVAQPVRVAVTGGTVSPGIFDVLEIVGKERTLKRLEKAVKLAGYEL
ncbi:MAG: glutamate--tRNA ligase [Nitrospiraceae bacterium]|nr:glutamate--tRNA ligase [Nitrospiraceae bacterium]